MGGCVCVWRGGGGREVRRLSALWHPSSQQPAVQEKSVFVCVGWVGGWNESAWPMGYCDVSSRP